MKSVRPGAASWVVIGLVLSGMATTAANAATVEGRVRRVGLLEGANPLIRIGVWCFVEVELRLRAESPFGGELRVNQLDRDGDVAVSTMPVALTPDGEWRPYPVYFVPMSVNSVAGMKIRLYDERGRGVSMIDETGVEAKEISCAQQVLALDHRDYLILDLSTPRRLSHLVWLDRDIQKVGNHTRARKVRRMPPQDLPSRPQGLEAADAIVWNDADPSALAPQQIDALIGWVEAGGRLLISAGKNWQLLAGSRLSEALPVEITGLEDRRESPGFLEVVKSDSYAESLTTRYQKRPIQCCQFKPKEGSMPIPAETSSKPIVYRKLFGRGTITFVGASLDQLLPVPRRMTSLEEGQDLSKTSSAEDNFLRIGCEKVIARKLLALPESYEDHDSALNFGFGKSSPDLYSYLQRTIGFESVGASFLVFAILFGIAYTLIATIGSYWYMKKRGWLHHCWSAFAAVSVAGCLIGSVMVGAIRGVGTRVWQTTVVDAHAGSPDAHACTLFGVKTGQHTRLDVRLPIDAAAAEGVGDTCPLRVMAPSEEGLGDDSTFVAAERYKSLPVGLGLDEVPIRATLKQFQGQWHGRMNGSLEARLVVKKKADSEELTIDSYIRNRTGVDLKECLLFTTPEETAGESAFVNCVCLPVGDFAKEGLESELTGEPLRTRLYFRPAENPVDPPVRVDPLPQIDRFFPSWGANLATVLIQAPPAASAQKVSSDPDYSALLLLSFFNLTRPENGRVGFCRSYGRTLDCSHQLTRRSWILVGYSHEAPPASLQVNLARVQPEKSRTLYRFVIPVERI